MTTESFILSLLTAMTLTGGCLLLITRAHARKIMPEPRSHFSESHAAYNEHLHACNEIEPLPTVRPVRKAYRTK